MNERRAQLKTVLATIAAVIALATSPRVANAGVPTQQYATITSIREVASSAAVYGAKAVEISLRSDAPFDTDNSQQLMLIVGSSHFTHYHYADPTRRTIVFAIRRANFDALPDGSQVKVGLGNQRGTRWDAGPLNKSLLGKY